MTKSETAMILAMLNAYYAGGKNDIKTQVNAWHLIIGKYDFKDVQEAVLHFAENDTRQYASFPAVGLIVAEIRKAEKAKSDIVNEIIISVSYGRSYDMISDKAKTLINEDRYNEWLAMDAERFQSKSSIYKQYLKNKQLRLVGS